MTAPFCPEFHPRFAASLACLHVSLSPPPTAICQAMLGLASDMLLPGLHLGVLPRQAAQVLPPPTLLRVLLLRMLYSA
eukprot:2199634-Rhodomonas_salina.1